MAERTRRDMLRLAGGASLFGLAGCGAIGNESSTTPQFGSLWVQNFDHRPHTVHVMIREGGDVVYWRTKEATAASESQESGGVVFEEYPTEPGEYELFVRLDDGRRSEWRTFDFGEFDASCIGLTIQIGSYGGDNPGELSIWYTTNPWECRDDRNSASS